MNRHRLFNKTLLIMTVSFACIANNAWAETIKPKIVILGYFETSQAYGEKSYWAASANETAETETKQTTKDRPGELYYWIKGLSLTKRINVEGAFQQVWSNADGSIVALKIGPNSLHPAVNVMALGLDKQFDFSQSYWLINGIAGTSPKNGTIGDIVWTDYVVNGDVAHEVDAREIPTEWPTGYFPAGTTKPYPQPRVAKQSPDHVANWGESFHHNRLRTVFQLNKPLTQWAYKLTKDAKLPQTPAMQKVRAEYSQKPAHAASQVVIGATFSSETF